MGSLCSGEAHVRAHRETKGLVKPNGTAPKVKDSYCMIEHINELVESEVKSKRRILDARQLTDLSGFSIVLEKPNKDEDEVVMILDVSKSADLPVEPIQHNDIDSTHQLAELRQPESNIVKAVNARREKNFSRAMQLLEEELRTECNNGMLYVEMAKVHRDRGEFQEMAAMVEKSSELL